MAWVLPRVVGPPEGVAWRGGAARAHLHLHPRKRGSGQDAVQDSGPFQACAEDDAPALPGRTSPSC